MSKQRLSVGYVAGAHGLHGIVRIKLHDPGSEALRPGMRIHLVREAREEPARDSESLGAFTIARVDAAPGQPDRLRVVLQGIDGRDAAEALKGAAVQVERDDLPALEDDEFYLADVIGLPVQRRRGQTLQDLGKVVAVVSHTAQVLLEVQWRGRRGRPISWLIPAVPGLVLEVDEQRILVDPPPGMLPDELEEA